MRKAIITAVVCMLPIAACGDSGGLTPSNNNNNGFVAPCGNGDLDPGEDCDGSSLEGETCQSLGYAGGTLGCRNDCRFDLTGCEGAGLCGNGVLDPPERCDGWNLGGWTCADLGLGGGNLDCTPMCRFDSSGCDEQPECGDGVIGPGELCDGIDLDGQTCRSQTGLLLGEVTCDPDCQGFDTSGCYTCGNGTVEGPELCDTEDLGAETCASLTGHLHGTPTCGTTCLSFDTSGCHTCGDSVVEGPEACDGTDLGGLTCDLLGFVGGSLACHDPALTEGCSFDTSGCQLPINCQVDFFLGPLAPGVPKQVAGDLATATDDALLPCGFSPSFLRDHVLMFSLSSLGSLTVVYDMHTAPVSTLGLYRASANGCTDFPVDCRAIQNSIGTEYFALLGPGSYFLIVESEAEGQYSLELTSLAREDCANGSDDDGDGLIDCEDTSDCCIDPVCYGGPWCAGLDGQPCQQPSDCMSDLCLTEDASGFPGGLCTRDCSQGCLPETLCTWVFHLEAYVCLPRCPSGSSLDCRPGYLCSWTMDSGENICMPHCTEPIQCDGGGGCGAHHLCGASPGSIPNGGPCTTHQECRGGFCFCQSDYGAPGGYCTSFCNLS
ncbi:MAG: hypothetical protein RBU30_10165, partial [Polyangia bacterium]|nr:hypothetical protein [Polyangia bacterium]